MDSGGRETTSRLISTGSLPRIGGISPSGGAPARDIEESRHAGDVSIRLNNLDVRTQFIEAKPRPKTPRKIRLEPIKIKRPDLSERLSSDADEEFRWADVRGKGVITLADFRKWYYERCLKICSNRPVDRDRSTAEKMKPVRVSIAAPPHDSGDVRSPKSSPEQAMRTILSKESAKTDAFAWLISGEDDNGGSGSVDTNANEISRAETEEAYSWLVEEGDDAPVEAPPNDEGDSSVLL